MVCFNPAFFTLGRTVHSRQPFTYQRATTTDPLEMKQGPLSKPARHQKEPPGLPLRPRPVPKRAWEETVCSSCPCPLPSRNLSGTPPPGPVGLVWSHFSQEGCPDPSTDWTGAPQTCLEFFRRQIRVQRGNRKLCLQSTEGRFRLECVCASSESFRGHGAHPWGSPFWSLCSSHCSWLPSSPCGPWRPVAGGISAIHLGVWQTCFESWTKWVCHSKGNNWQYYLLPMRTFNLSNEN